MASADRSTLFINATILDGSEHMEPQPDMAVTVERGVITWMGPSAVAQAPAGAEVIDLGGAYLMPGLINMHVHLCGSGKPVSAGDAGALMKKLDNPVGRAIVRHILKGSAQQQLASGVTTVRGAGDPLFADLAVRDAVKLRELLELKTKLDKQNETLAFSDGGVIDEVFVKTVGFGIGKAEADRKSVV